MHNKKSEVFLQQNCLIFFFILLFHFVSNLFLYVNIYAELYKLMSDQIECKFKGKTAIDSQTKMNDCFTGFDRNN